jgi:aspartate racemase
MAQETDSNHQREKIVGVLGGMGPDATVDLMARVISATPAEDDIDHIHMIVDNNPKVPSRINALVEGTGQSPAAELVKMAKRLETAGADFLAMPCNTAHFYYGDIVEAVNIPVINMIDSVVQTVSNSDIKIKSVGMLASTAVQITKLYEKGFAKESIKASFPSANAQKNMMAFIKCIKANNIRKTDISLLNECIEEFKEQGITCIVIACTELSVIAKQLETDLPIFDASQILANEIVNRVK